MEGKAIDQLSVLGDALLKEIIGSSYIHVDETGLLVLLGKENSKSKKMHNGYLWVVTAALKTWYILITKQAGVKNLP